MIVLGLDTVAGSCSVALVEATASDERVLASRREQMARGHAERLFGLVLEVCQTAGIDLKSVSRFAVTTGPGSFTGTRVGMAAARGLALAAGRPLIGLTSLEVLAGAAAGRGGDREILAVMDARRDELYTQRFAPDLAPRSEPSVSLIGDIARVAGPGPVFLVGSGAPLAAPVLRAAGIEAQIDARTVFPDAAVLARLAASRAVPARPPAPFYLRAPDAKLPGGRAP